MIRFPASLEDVGLGEVRAGGTDVTDRRKLGVSTGPVEDLRDVPDLDILAYGTTLAIGARVPVARLADNPTVRAGWPALAEAAAILATPQIRAVATVGGNLLQRPRCAYFRHPELVCLKRGGAECLARGGDMTHLACVDLGPCVAVHASTLAVALLAYDATARVFRGPGGSLAELYGDGTDPAREHRLPAGAVLVGVDVPAAAAGEHAAHVRIASRARAEWPLVEVTVRTAPGFARVAAGGIAPIPLRLEPVEAALAAGRAWPPALERLAASWRVPEATAWKVRLIEAAIATALERAA